jgi:hypothetical protein
MTSLQVAGVECIKICKFQLTDRRGYCRTPFASGNNYEALSRNQVQKGKPVSKGQIQGILKRGLFGTFHLQGACQLAAHSGMQYSGIYY